MRRLHRHTLRANAHAAVVVATAAAVCPVLAPTGVSVAAVPGPATEARTVAADSYAPDAAGTSAATETRAVAADSYAPDAAGTSAATAGALVYPAPPETARIRYEASIRSLNSWKPRRGLLRRIARAITGSAPSARLVRPLGVTAVGRTLYVTDPGAACVHALRGADSSYVRIPREHPLESPVDVAADATGAVYVTDSKQARVLCYDAGGKLLRSLPGPWRRPTGIAYDESSGRLYVVDTSAHTVISCLPDGTDRRQIGTRGGENGEFNFPTAVRLAGQTSLYVVDAMNFRVQRFGRDGAFAAAFGRLGDGSGNFSRPKGIAVDTDNHVYVVDALFDAVQIFDRGGNFLLAFGESGRGAGQFWLPSGIAIDNDNRIFVADAYNRRVQVFRYLGAENASSRER